MTLFIRGGNQSNILKFRYCEAERARGERWWFVIVIVIVFIVIVIEEGSTLLYPNSLFVINTEMIKMSDQLRWREGGVCLLSTQNWSRRATIAVKLRRREESASESRKILVTAAPSLLLSPPLHHLLFFIVLTLFACLHHRCRHLAGHHRTYQHHQPTWV